jgi:5-methylthioadenosine/S-adenosylhomocysteine deaminase
MVRIVIQNTSILTLDGDDTFFYPGVLEIRDDKIYSIKEWNKETILEDYFGETIIIDGTDKLVMPGLVDLHFHTSVAKVIPQQSSHTDVLR